MLFLEALAYFCVWALSFDHRASAQSTLKIAGGEYVPPYRFPYMASLRNPRRNDEHFCGGALIGPNLVVTAAHCIDCRLKDPKIHPYPNVWIGLVNRDGDKRTEKRETVRTYMHKKWKPSLPFDPCSRKKNWTEINLKLDETADNSSNAFDVAVLELNKSSTKKPIEIDWVGSYLTRSTFIAIGFGINATGGSPPRLSQINMEYVSTLFCDSYENYTDRITFDMLCAKWDSDAVTDVCQGDSGGPLILPHSPLKRLRNEDRLAGIVSFGQPCLKRKKNFPGVFTRAEEFRRWILKGHKKKGIIFQNPKYKKKGV